MSSKTSTSASPSTEKSTSSASKTSVSKSSASKSSAAKPSKSAGSKTDSAGSQSTSATSASSKPSGSSASKSKSSKTTTSSGSSSSQSRKSEGSSRSSSSSSGSSGSRSGKSSRTDNTSSTGNSASTDSGSKTTDNTSSTVTSYPSSLSGSSTPKKVCLVERDIWIVEGLVTTLFACLIAGFFIKNFVEWAGLVAAKRNIIIHDGLGHRLLTIIFVGQAVLVPLQATKYAYGFIKDDRKYMSAKTRLVAELLLFSGVMVVAQTLSFDFMVLHLLITCCYLAPTIATLAYLFWFYKVIVPADSRLAAHSLCTVFTTFCFKEYFLNRHFCNCQLF